MSIWDTHFLNWPIRFNPRDPFGFKMMEFMTGWGAYFGGCGYDRPARSRHDVLEPFVWGRG